MACDAHHALSVQDDGACVGLYSKRCCNHWVSWDALKEYISHQVSECLDPAAVPCPQCLAEPCEKCAAHGQRQSATGHKLCCIPVRQVRSFLSEELALRYEAHHRSIVQLAIPLLSRFLLPERNSSA